ncbi:MAG: hypothetical protein K2X77_02245 [Candidatus Obscuribacterales bacterium]|jgi:hypothetical protein|nr:hypothetical protein [Candidatus Obscuribacterales bacterium]
MLLQSMPLSICLIVPIGPIISLLKSWFGSSRAKLKKATEIDLPYPLQEPQLFSLKDEEKLPFPENEAIANARNKVTEGEFEAAKMLLVKAWIDCSGRESNEIAQTHLRKAIAELYTAQKDERRAQDIANMPLLTLDSEVRWLLTHPHAQIGSKLSDEQQDS